MYYLKNTDTNGMGCLCSQEFKPDLPYKQDVIDGKYIATALQNFNKQPAAHRPWRQIQHQRQMSYERKPSNYSTTDARDFVTMPSNPLIGLLTTGGKSDSLAPFEQPAGLGPAYSDIQHQIMADMTMNPVGPGLRQLEYPKTPARGGAYVPNSAYAMNAPRHPFKKMTAVSPRRVVPVRSPVRTTPRSPRSRVIVPSNRVGVRYPKAYGVNERRSAGYKKEHFDVAPFPDYPSPFDYNSNQNFQPVDYGNTIVGGGIAPYDYQVPTQQTDPVAYDTAIRAFYDSLGYPNFNPQPIGYDFSGGSTPQISIDPLSYNQLPHGYRENFVPHPANYGKIRSW